MSARRAGISLLALLVAPLASAEAEPARTVYDLPLEALVHVTVASPLEGDSAGTAASVSVLEPEDWQSHAARTLDEALEQIPSVATFSSLDSARMISVRGYANEISVRGLATLLDGVPLNNYSYATSFYDLPFVPLDLLQRVEMIRGPGSTLYGSDAFHGVLSLSTVSDDMPSARAVAAAGSPGDGVTGVSLRATEDDLEVQGGAVVTRQADRDLTYDYHDPVTGQTARGERGNAFTDRSAVLNLSAGHGDSPTGRWSLGLYGNDYRSRQFPGVGTQFYPPIGAKFPLQSLSLAADHDLAGQDSHFAMARLGYESRLADNLELKLLGYHWQAEQTWIFDFSALPTGLRSAGGATVACRTAITQTGVLPTFCPHIMSQGTGDTRDGLQASLVWRPADATQWVVGAGQDRLTVDRAFVRRIGLDGTVYLDTLTPFNDVSRRVSYAWLHARTDWLDGRLSALYGVRRDDYSDTGAATSPRVGLIWRATPVWTGKLVYNHAFRAPSAAERYGGGPGSQQLENPGIRPETIDTWEAMWEYRRDDRTGGLTLFRSRWNDGIVLNPVTGTSSQYQNTGANESWGAELSHAQSLGDWSVSGNVSWVRSRNRVSGLEYSAFPRVLANLSLGREFDRGWTLQLNERLMFKRSLSDALAGQTPSAAPDYYRTDLHLQREIDDWRCWLDIRNLFNRGNIESALFNAEGGLPEEGINARLGVERRW